jgi:hypothetical protein
MVMALLTATFLYNGLSDYWGGDGDRWDNDKGCVFASYGAFTTLRDIIDDAVDDFCAGGDCDSMPEEVTENDVRVALLDCLSPTGRADYASGAVAECAAYYAATNGYDRCSECGESIGDPHEDGCEVAEECECSVVEEDCLDEDDHYDSPICIFLLACEVCSECGKVADVDVLGCCEDCQETPDDAGYDEDSDTVDVVFLRDSDSLDVFAVFPGLAATVGRVDHITCYAHVGQHSAADIGYCLDCDEVTDRAEYTDLFDELVSRGYNLYVVRLDRIKDASYAHARADQLASF